MSVADAWSDRDVLVAAVATGLALLAATAAVLWRRTRPVSNPRPRVVEPSEPSEPSEQSSKSSQPSKPSKPSKLSDSSSDSTTSSASSANQPVVASTATPAIATAPSAIVENSAIAVVAAVTPPRPRRARRLTDAQKTALLELNLEQISDASDMVAHGVASVSASVSASGVATPVAEITPPATPKPQTIASKLAALTSSASGASSAPGVGRQRSGTSPTALSPASSVPSSAVSTPRADVTYQLGVASPAQPGTPQTARRRAQLKREATREFQQERAARRAAAALTLHLAEAERRLRVNEEARLRRVEWAARQLNLPTVLAQTEVERQRLAQTFAPTERVELVQRERRDQLLSLVALSNVEAQAPARDRSVRARVSLASERAKELVSMAAERERQERERQERKEREEREEVAARKQREEAAAAAAAARKAREAAAAAAAAEQARVLERAESERHMEREREKQREAERALEQQREAERERDRQREREREVERERLAATLASPRKTASPSKPAAAMRAASAVGGGERCVVCEKRAYLLERVTVDGAILHKACFKCADCAGTISITSYVAHGGQYYCRIHGANKPPEPKQPATPTANPLRTRSAEKYTPSAADEAKEAVAAAAAAAAAASPSTGTDEGARAAIRRLVGEDVLDDDDDGGAVAVASSSDSVTEDAADTSLGSSMDTASGEDETRRFLPQPGMVRAYGGFDATFNTGKRGTVTGKAALLLWCQRSTVLYPGCAQLVTNFTTSWKNGLAFCALVDCHRPGSLQPLDYLQLAECDDEKRLDAAFSAAELCGVPRLLDAEDLVEMSVPDQLSIITYLSEVYKCFVGNH